MKHLTKLRIAFTIALVALGITSAFAQNSVPTPQGTLYLNLRNVANPTTDQVTENPDLITTGTRVQYLVIPDPILNSGWATAAAADATVTTGISSTWTWTVPNTIGTLNATPSNSGHYIYLNVTGAISAAGIVNVKEQSGASCPDATGTDINVKVIAQPAASALAVSDGTGSTICTSNANGSVNLARPIFTVTKTTDASIPGNAGVRVKASLVFTDHLGNPTILVPAGTILNVNGAGEIDNAELEAAATANSQSYDDLDSWGTYVLTVTQISDKISRKDINAAAGYFNVNGATGFSATYTVLKAAKTGAIYHLPNN